MHPLPVALFTEVTDPCTAGVVVRKAESLGEPEIAPDGDGERVPLREAVSVEEVTPEVVGSVVGDPTPKFVGLTMGLGVAREENDAVIDTEGVAVSVNVAPPSPPSPPWVRVTADEGNEVGLPVPLLDAEGRVVPE